MKTRSLLCAVIAVAIGTQLTKLAPIHIPASPAMVHSALPSESAAKAILNATHRHREWVRVRAGAAVVRGFLVYPERPDTAPVVVVTGKEEGASGWVRSVAGQLAADGFLAAVPDVLSGMGPHGGDTASLYHCAASL